MSSRAPHTHTRSPVQKSVTWAVDPEAGHAGGVAGPPNTVKDSGDHLSGNPPNHTDGDMCASDPKDEAQGQRRMPACCFQCRKCNTIVGDTSDWVTSNRKAKTISLERAREVKVQEKLHMSSAGEDYGSVYSKVICKSCKTELGKMYRNTSPEFDLARNAYTFDADKILCYVLGSNSTPLVSKKTLSEAEEEIASKLGVNVKDMDTQIGNLYDAVNDLSVKFLRFQDEHVKMENVFLVWEQRISQMEQALTQLQWNQGSSSGCANNADSPRQNLGSCRRVGATQMVPPKDRGPGFSEPYRSDLQGLRKGSRQSWDLQR